MPFMLGVGGSHKNERFLARESGSSYLSPCLNDMFMSHTLYYLILTASSKDHYHLNDYFREGYLGNFTKEKIIHIHPVMEYTLQTLFIHFLKCSIDNL